MKCSFCNVIESDVNNQIILKGKHVTAIRKLYKANNVNFLIISNEHIENMKDSSCDDKEKINNILCEIKDMANQLSGGRDWSLKINNGSNASQTEFHFHAHIYSQEHPRLWKSLY